MAMPPEFSVWLNSPDGEKMREDILAWSKYRKIDLEPLAAFEILSNSGLREFRSLVDYRLTSSKSGNEFKSHVKWARANDLYIICNEIGPRFIIQHGHSTWIFAERIGSDFMVNQNVTIGMSKGGRPTIGNNVGIRTGAVVTGPITIGNNCIIGPCAFVNFDVPDDTVVLPPRAIMHPRKRRG